MKKQFNSIQIITYTAMLGALAFIINLIEIPYIIPYLKFDFSDVIVLIAVSLSLSIGIYVAILKGILLFLFKGGSIAGMVSAIMGSLTIAISYYYLSKKLNKIMSLIISAILFTLIMVSFNFFIIDPLYMGMSFTEAAGQDNYLTRILLTYVPFNIIKSSIIIFIYYYVSNILEKLAV